MTAPTVLLVLLLVAAVAVLALWLWRRPVGSRPATRAWEEPGPITGTRVVLDLTVDDPDDPALQRLVHDAASRAMRDDPAVDRVEVVDRDGRLLGVESRSAPLREIVLPEQLHEPQVPRSRTPSVVPHARPHHRRPSEAPDDLTVVGRPLADRLDLAPAVRASVREPDRVVDVVRAVLEAAGRPVVVDGDLVVSDDVAIAVVDTCVDPERALTHGFLRIAEGETPRGLVLRTGHVDPRVLRRREAAAPHVRHVGLDALQRMADAAALGADPIAFAAAPAIRR